MAITREIWINSIVGLLFADNTFAARSIDHSAFVNSSTVHVPNAGDVEAARKTRLRNAGAVNLAQERTDVDLEYNIEKYYVGPIVVPQLEQAELSYNKRESIVSQITSQIKLALYGDLLTKWIPSAVTKLATTGANVAASAPSATGTRKSIVKADVLNLRTQFDKWDLPQEGRCLLLDANMYAQLLNSLTETEAMAFLASASAQTGLIGKLYGFDIYERSTVLVTTSAGALKTGAAAATDCVAGLAWSDRTVSRAIGNINVYDKAGDAGEFGDVLSVDVAAGGSFVRKDGKGIVILYQG